jgi:membrane-associated phospholipid phosphatase
MKACSLLAAAALFCALASFAQADTTSTVVSAGDGVAIAVPIVAGAITLYKNDTTGLAELGVDTLLTVGTTYALSHIVREERPDHSDFHSFPSNTTALAAAPAAFLWQRYGWQYGVPAYAATAFVAYSRVDGQQHHWWDVMASGVIGLAYSEIFTTRFRNQDRLTASATPVPGGVMLGMTYRW